MDYCEYVPCASEAELPDIDSADIVVRQLLPAERRVAPHFSKPRIAYIGAYTGCGCGFIYGDPVERSASIEALLTFLELHAPHETLELFVRPEWCDELALTVVAA
jgi:hypothetical protein